MSSVSWNFPIMKILEPRHFILFLVIRPFKYLAPLHKFSLFFFSLSIVGTSFLGFGRSVRISNLCSARKETITTPAVTPLTMLNIPERVTTPTFDYQNILEFNSPDFRNK